MPENTTGRKEEVRGTKKTKQRISVFLTCNADGSEKLEAMVIGRAATPVAFCQARYVEPVAFRQAGYVERRRKTHRLRAITTPRPGC